ncbi:Coatomer subunit epsilon-1 [Leucoagaricus sp. SymC.cos]|nr:Coatomer subunit epsilon-1 [Leucoagaricus sp. SymC.cos]
MDSSELYHVKQQFFLGAYKSLADLGLPDTNSPDYTRTLLYKARALIALDQTVAASQLLSNAPDSVSVKAALSLARYVGASDAAARELALEELRDLSVEIESDDVDGDERDKALVKVLAGTAFARAGEIEEALETLGTDTEDLEAVAVIVQIYVAINRSDLAKKQFERSKRWAEDDLLLQLIESTIGLATGRDAYHNPSSFYTEQLANPSLSSPHILTSRGVTRVLRNEFQEAKSDLEESLEQQKDDAETLAAFVVAGGLGAVKKQEAIDLWSQMLDKHPNHPLVQDLSQKADLFDQAVTKFTVPPLASTI